MEPRPRPAAHAARLGRGGHAGRRTATRCSLNYDQEADSALYCLDAATGKTEVGGEARREDDAGTRRWSSSHGGKTQVVTNGTTRIRSYDLADRRRCIWECGGMTVNPIPSPVRFGDAVICVSGYRGAAAVSVPLDSKGDLGRQR